MSKIRSTKNGGLAFWCPGCKEVHALAPGVWVYNGDSDLATFSPSVLIRSGHYVPGHDGGQTCWCTYEERFGKKAPFVCFICHSFVRDGRIQFLGDSTHGLAGQTVDIPEWPYAPGAYGGIDP